MASNGIVGAIGELWIGKDVEEGSLEKDQYRD